MNRNTLTRMSFLLAPPLIMAGWALMRLLGSEGREPGWTIAHLVWLAGYVLLGVACLALFRLTVAPAETELATRRRAAAPTPDASSSPRFETAGRTAFSSSVDTRRPNRRLALPLLAVALLGDVCMNAQMSIDLIAGFATSTVEAKNAFTDEVQAVPGVELMVYQLGPALLFTALLAQTVHARIVGRVATAIPVLVGAAVAIMVVDRTVDTPFRLTMGVAAALLWIAFVMVVKSPSPSAARAIPARER